jgi:hypothetical protein
MPNHRYKTGKGADTFLKMGKTCEAVLAGKF